jgi:hypothetical protein
MTNPVVEVFEPLRTAATSWSRMEPGKANSALGIDAMSADEKEPGIMR